MFNATAESTEIVEKLEILLEICSDLRDQYQMKLHNPTPNVLVFRTCIPGRPQININEVEKIKKYLISQRDGVVTSPDITFNLKRRITSNKFVLANFASGTDCVCVLQKTMTVSYHDFLSFHIHNRKTVLPITLLL